MKRTDVRHNLNKNATLQDHISKTKKSQLYFVAVIFCNNFFERKKIDVCAHMLN